MNEEKMKRAMKQAINELFHKGQLLIGNTALALKAPPGVMPVAAKWKMKV